MDIPQILVRVSYALSVFHNASAVILQVHHVTYVNMAMHYRLQTQPVYPAQLQFHTAKTA
jgi:hypothetical protein